MIQKRFLILIKHFLKNQLYQFTNMHIRRGLDLLSHPLKEKNNYTWHTLFVWQKL
jgi:hypothetical protein